MQRKTLSVVALILAAAASGCKDISTPQGAVGALLSAVANNNLDDFRDALHIDALGILGDSATMQYLRGRLLELDSHRTVQDHYDYTVENRGTQGRETLYRVTGRGDRGAMEFLVACRVHHVRRHTNTQISGVGYLEDENRCYTYGWQ
jgi:hypothetical protein